MKIALIGTGHIHIGDFVDVLNKAGLEPGYVYDPSPERADAVAERLGWPAARNLPALANLPEIDGLIVASQTNEHPGLIAALAGTGKSLFVEKPLATLPETARALGASLKNPDFFHTGYFLRQIPAIRAIKDRIESGALGVIDAIDMSYSHSGLAKGWFGGYEWMQHKAMAGYGGFGDMGLHCVDMLTWLSGRQPDGVKAITGRVAGMKTDVRDHYGVGWLTAENGPALSFYAGWQEDPDFKGERPKTGSLFSLHVAGTKGQAFLSNNEAWCETADGKETLPALRFSSGDSIALFLDSVRTGDPSLLTGVEKPVRDIRTMDALYQAAALGNKVGLNPPARSAFHPARLYL